MSTDLIYLVEITAYDPAIPGTTTLRYTSGTGLMTRPSESPANVWFDPRLQAPISFKRTMYSNVRVTGGASVGTGDIVLNNQDQALAYLRDLGIDGRDVVVRVGPQGAAYPTGYTTFLTGTADQVEVGARTVTIRLRDKLQVLQLPLQATLYAGSNVLPAGVEGTADDIKGQRKPLLFGRGWQIEPVRVNTAREIWQIHDGAMQAVDAVYDQGVALTPGTNRANLAAMEAAAPAAGAYDTCLSAGYIRLGAAPAGKITVDARGDNSGGYVETAAEIVERILVQRAGISALLVDVTSVSALAGAAPYETGVYAIGEMTRQQAIDIVLSAVGGWLAPDRDGAWVVGRLEAPTGSPGFTFTDVEIEGLDAVATRDAEAGVPIWRAKLRGLPYAALGRADLAGAVTEADKARLLQPWREAVASDASVQTMHLLAGELVRDTAIQDLTDLGTEAARVLALHKVRRDFTQAAVWLTQERAGIDLGSEVRLTTTRLGYGSGRDFRVVGIELDSVSIDGVRRPQLKLDLWG